VKRSHSRFLIRLYPSAWRTRYGPEFQTFLESRQVPLWDVLNIAACGLMERVSEAWQAALPLIGFAYWVTVAVGFSFYVAISDHPSALLWLCWAGMVATCATLTAFRLGSAGPATLSVFALGALSTLVSIVAALRLGTRQLAVAVAMLWVSQIWRGLTRHYAAIIVPGRRKLALLGIAMLSSAAFGLIHRGGFAGNDIWSLLFFPILVITDTLWVTRRVLAEKR